MEQNLLFKDNFRRNNTYQIQGNKIWQQFYIYYEIVATYVVLQIYQFGIINFDKGSLFQLFHASVKFISNHTMTKEKSLAKGEG